MHTLYVVWEEGPLFGLRKQDFILELGIFSTLIFFSRARTAQHFSDADVARRHLQPAEKFSVALFFILLHPLYVLYLTTI